MGVYAHTIDTGFQNVGSSISSQKLVKFALDVSRGVKHLHDNGMNCLYMDLIIPDVSQGIFWNRNVFGKYGGRGVKLQMSSGYLLPFGPCVFMPAMEVESGRIVGTVSGVAAVNADELREL